MIRAAIIALAALCLAGKSPAAPTPEAKAYLDTALSLIEQHHYNSGEADWVALRAMAFERAGDAEVSADTYGAIDAVLLELGERHSFLRRPIKETTAPSSAQAPSSASAEASEQQLPRYTYLEDHEIGFVQLFGLDTQRFGAQGGERYRAVLQQALEALDAKARCGWIIDLKENTGGNMWPMLAGLDPLLGDGPFGFFHRKDGVTIGWYRGEDGIYGRSEPVSAPPSFMIDRADAPLAILTGPNTASSGEMTALALIGRENVRSFGFPTAGYVTANQSFPLSDGAMLAITVSFAGDRNGEITEKLIIPDEIVPMREAHLAAIDWLTGQCEPKPTAH